MAIKNATLSLWLSNVCSSEPIGWPVPFFLTHFLSTTELIQPANQPTIQPTN